MARHAVADGLGEGAAFELARRFVLDADLEESVRALVSVRYSEQAAVVFGPPPVGAGLLVAKIDLNSESGCVSGVSTLARVSFVSTGSPLEAARPFLGKSDPPIRCESTKRSTSASL
jgi:hypothetical protein